MSATGSKAMSRSPAGFTLLEVLVVLVIIALIAAVALPNLRRSPALELRTAADQVNAALRQTRVDAMTRGRTQALLVDTQARTLQPEGGAVRALADHFGVLLDTAERERISDHQGGIRFWPDGSATGGRVTLQTDGLQIRVDVEWLTGRVRTSAIEAADG